MSIFDVPLSEIREPNELAHFGVKGMKWGRRKQRVSRAQRRHDRKAQKQRDREATKALNRAADAHIRSLSRSKIGSARTRIRKPDDVYNRYYGFKPQVGRLDSALLRSGRGSRRAALGRARVITRQRRQAARVDPMRAWLDTRTGLPTNNKVIFGVAQGDSAQRIKRRAGGVLREYRRQRDLQRRGVTYRKAEPQPWDPKFIGSRINRKYALRTK